jgi:hypothetical protein
MTSLQATHHCPPSLGDRVVSKRHGLARRQRAKKACVHCRARKVRCDINVHGWPCTVCRQDDSECTIVARKKIVNRKRADNRLVTVVMVMHTHSNQMEQSGTKFPE